MARGPFLRRKLYTLDTLFIFVLCSPFVVTNAQERSVPPSPNKKPIGRIAYDRRLAANILSPHMPSFAEIFVIDADGKNVRKIRSLHLPVLSIGWSPDGKTLAVSAKSAPIERSSTAPAKEPGQSRGGIFLLPATGDGTFRLVIEGGSDLSWSPYGTNIAYSANRGK